jgi:hypothetical protein
MGDWPTNAKQQKICKRGDTRLCEAIGARGCEMCMPCRYADEQITARKLPVSEVRAKHARDIEANPLDCAECFNKHPQEARENLITEYLDWLGKEPAPHVAEGLRQEIRRAMAGFSDAQLTEARDWSGNKWREWILGNLPPVPAVSE